MNLFKRVHNQYSQYTTKRTKKLINQFVAERSFTLQFFLKKINPYKLIYKYKTEGIAPKHFNKNQNPIQLFEDLGNGNINPK